VRWPSNLSLEEMMHEAVLGRLRPGHPLLSLRPAADDDDDQARAVSVLGDAAGGSATTGGGCRAVL
jgi:hypothetical protein